MNDARWQVLDWRRKVFELYRAVREEQDARAAHAVWVEGRDRLLMRHPASPVPAGERGAYPGANVAPYDGDYRFVVQVDRDVPKTRRDVPTATDGVVPFELMGRVTLPGLGSLDVWWAAVFGGGVFLPFRDTTSRQAVVRRRSVRSRHHQGSGPRRSSGRAGGRPELRVLVSGAHAAWSYRILRSVPETRRRAVKPGVRPFAGTVFRILRAAPAEGSRRQRRMSRSPSYSIQKRVPPGAGHDSPPTFARTARRCRSSSYQPSCAYDDAWVCPLPGLGNTLGEAVPLGELSARP